MTHSSGTARKRKLKTPDKPHDGFPLFAHQTGRWARKFKGKFRFYGRWGNMVAGEVVQVDDVEGSASAAQIEHDRCWPYHSIGLDAPIAGETPYLTMDALANDFLNSKRRRRESGELSPHTFDGYHRICTTLVDHFGAGRRVDSISPSDFEVLRAKMAGSNLTTLKNKVNLARVVFKFAFDSRLIEKRVHFGESFNKPSKTNLQKARNEAGPKFFERDELLAILATFEQKKAARISTASPTLHAMILLGLNGGFGNTDVANLPKSAVNLETGWIEFPRQKTGVKRRVPLWPETISAIRETVASRPKAENVKDDGLCFLTRRGTPFVRVQPSKSNEKRFVMVDGVLRQFDKLLTTIKIGLRKGLGFYTLRHVFETVAGGCKDQVAVDAIMGHMDQSMAAHYREGIDDARLRAVVDHVHDWLWLKSVKEKPVKALKAKAVRKKP